MKRVSETENNLVRKVPAIRRIGVIRVQPLLAVIVPLDVEHLRIAVGIGNVHTPISTTTP